MGLPDASTAQVRVEAILFSNSLAKKHEITLQLYSKVELSQT